tara:strand:- start:136 stop:378 length:243 start_codon:yes stop_codon:yes gene_type:complete
MDKPLINNMTIFKDGVINIQVKCNKCDNINIHTIKKDSYRLIDGNIIIDFSKLGKRYCDGISDFKNPNKSKCNNVYNIYN